MTKRIWIPVSAVAEPEAVEFLELSLAQDADPDPYRSLGASGLETAVASARRARASLPRPESQARIEVVALSGKALTNSSGAALALTLGPLLGQAGFGYRDYLIIGGLRLPETGLTPPRATEIHITSVHATLPKLRAIHKRGYRVEPMLLLLPQDGLTPEADALLRDLAALNIAVRRVSTLDAAYRACGGVFPDTGASP